MDAEPDDFMCILQDPCDKSGVKVHIMNGEDTSDKTDFTFSKEFCVQIHRLFFPTEHGVEVDVDLEDPPEFLQRMVRGELLRRFHNILDGRQEIPQRPSEGSFQYQHCSEPFNTRTSF